MALSADGHGQVLIYPYYTANGGNQTLLTITNTRNEAKAVRVRFRESLNGRVVLQLSLYLGPMDMWSAAIVPESGIGAPLGAARLLSADTSCTLPQMPADGLPFSSRDYTDNRADGGPNRQDHPDALRATYSAPERTRAGSIEVIEMGVLQPGPAPTQLAEEVTARPPADPLTEPAQPADCAAVARAWLPGNGGWADVGSARDIGLPGGGLTGIAAIVDVGDGTWMGTRAEAVTGFHTNAAAAGALHHAADSVSPDLGDCDHGNGRCNVLFALTNGPSHRFVFESGGARAWDAFTTLFMAEVGYGEHLTEPWIAARSEWALTMPTRHFYVDRQSAVPLPVRAPFRSADFASTGRSCEPYTFRWFNREAFPGDPFEVHAPRPPFFFVPPRPCFQGSLATFNETRQLGPVLGQDREFSVDLVTTGAFGPRDPALAPQLVSGYVEFLPQNGPDPPTIVVDTEQTWGGPQRYARVVGLPWSGIAFRTMLNANAQPGLLARYGGAWPVQRRRALLQP
jgi:hypothetical protein